MLNSFRSGLAVAAAVFAVAFVAPSAFAQPADATIPTAGSEAFLGAWDVNLEGDAGPVQMKVTVTDNGGRLAATITGSTEGVEGREIQRIAKNGNALAITYALSMGGQSIPTTLTLTPEDNAMKASLDLGGMLSMSGSATKGS